MDLVEYFLDTYQQYTVSGVRIPRTQPSLSSSSCWMMGLSWRSRALASSTCFILPWISSYSVMSSWVISNLHLISNGNSSVASTRSLIRSKTPMQSASLVFAWSRGDSESSSGSSFSGWRWSCLSRYVLRPSARAYSFLKMADTSSCSGKNSVLLILGSSVSLILWCWLISSMLTCACWPSTSNTRAS